MLAGCSAFPGAGLGGSPHSPVHPTLAMALGASSVGLPFACATRGTALHCAVVGHTGEGPCQPQPRAARGLGRGWRLPGPCHQADGGAVGRERLG